MAKKATSPANQQPSPSEFDWDQKDRIIWKLNRLKNEDWNFEPHQHELQGKEGRVAVEYEFARNKSWDVEKARKISQMDLESRQKAKRSRGQIDEDDFSTPQFLPGPWFEPEFPDTPWFCISDSRRREIARLSRNVSYGDPLRSMELGRVIGDFYNSSAVGWDYDLGNGTYLCAFVIDRTFTDHEIKESLQKEWLDHHPEEKDETRNRPKRQHWLPLLRALGMMRVLDCYCGNRVKSEIFLKNEFHLKRAKHFNTSQSAWSKAKILTNNYLNGRVK